MDKKRVVIDARMVGSVGHGIGMYVEDLAEGLAQRSLPYDILFLTSAALGHASSIRKFPHKEVDVPFLHPLEAFRLPRVLDELKPSLFHSPSFSCLWRYPCAYLLTLHDLNHLHFGSLAQKLYYRFLVRPALRAASRVFTVSRVSQQEIMHWAPGIRVDLAKNAIRPWPEVEEEEANAILQKFQLQRRAYFFSLSNPKPHKNLALLKRAHRVYQKESEAKGTASWPLVLSLAGPAEKGIVSTGPLTPKEISVILGNCAAFYFPSLYEGFGRPPLEAALFNIPLVVSRIAAHEEALAIIPSSNVTFLGATDEPAWTQAFHQKHRLVSDTKTEILNEYSVEKLASTMDKAYQELLGIGAAPKL